MTLLEKIRAKKQVVASETVSVAKKGLDKVKDARAPKPKSKLKMSALDALKVFGHSSFREGQEEVINEVVGGSDGVLAVFPTGYGKSLAFQLPSLMSDNLTVVVSPLIALMKDQVDKLQSLGVNAILINSTLTDKETTIALAEVSSGGITALYVAPERFRNKQFISAIQKMDIDILAIDEAHCFIGDTMVLTPEGERRIDSLRVGDSVISSLSGGAGPVIGKVSRLFLHRGMDVWKIRINGRDTYCDGGQEFFVKNTGFVSVDRLQCGHEIIIEAEGCVRGVRDGSGDASSEGEASEQVLLSEMPEGGLREDENGCDGGQGVPDVQEAVSDKAGIQDRALLDAMWPAFGEEEGGVFGEDGSGQSDERPDCSGRHVEKSEGNRQAQRPSRGERKGSDEGRELSCRCGKSLNKLHCSDGSLSGREWLSNTLQAGLVVAVGKSHGGSGRPLSQVAEDTGSRPPEGVVFDFARVESVSRVEQGSTLPTGECLGKNPVGVRLYDIEVEGTHSFFANGSLVHNCISRWGHDFRPAYSDLGGAVEMLDPRQVVALTATATKKVRDDICHVLGIPNAKRFVKSVYRKNLQLGVIQETGYSRLNTISELVRDFKEDGDITGIIYSTTRREAEEICKHLKDRGLSAMFYHAGLKPVDRSEVQNKWVQEGGVIVATCAFGMGIDKADVRFVFHSGLSPSIEDWYQSIGRAGRDGKDSLCLTICDFKDDYRTQMFLINMTSPTGEDVNSFWEWLRGEAVSQAKAGAKSTEVKMTQKVMAEASGCQNVGACISVLKKKFLVETLGRGRYKVSLRDHTEIDMTVLTALRNEKIAKLNQVCNFYRTKGCRFDIVCEYFGDDASPGGCGHCDNCS